MLIPDYNFLKLIVPSGLVPKTETEHWVAKTTTTLTIKNERQVV